MLASAIIIKCEHDEVVQIKDKFWIDRWLTIQHCLEHSSTKSTSSTIELFMPLINKTNLLELMSFITWTSQWSTPVWNKTLKVIPHDIDTTLCLSTVAGENTLYTGILKYDEKKLIDLIYVATVVEDSDALTRLLDITRFHMYGHDDLSLLATKFLATKSEDGKQAAKDETFDIPRKSIHYRTVHTLSSKPLKTTK